MQNFLLAGGDFFAAHVDFNFIWPLKKSSSWEFIENILYFDLNAFVCDLILQVANINNH